jgi:D-glycero-alpha-D-manno-heptose-7-phosphate kinase
MIIVQTPLRISFAGGGTDLPQYYRRRGGAVVNAAIDKATFVIVSARYDDKIYVNYSRKEIVAVADEIQHELVRETMKLAGIRHGVEVTLLSDIPSGGSGLGSSSSFTVGLLNAFYQHRGEQVTPDRLAKEACEVEIGRCGKPIGKQDQYIAAFGGITAFGFEADGSVHAERLALTEKQVRSLSANLFLFYSDQTRSADDILAQQSRRTPENLEQLDRLKTLAQVARGALLSGDFDRIGHIMEESWSLKTTLASQITNARLNEMVGLAKEAGALGAKVCGAGGGGFVLIYCQPQYHQSLLEAMKNYRRMPITLEPDGSKVIFNYRRPSWK